MPNSLPLLSLTESLVARLMSEVEKPHARSPTFAHVDSRTNVTRDCSASRQQGSDSESAIVASIISPSRR